MKEVEKRYCPTCGAGVKAEASRFEHARTCPSCGTKVLFFDYLHPPNRPTIEVVPKKTFDEVVYRIGTVFVGLLSIVTAFSILFSTNAAGYVVSMICLVWTSCVFVYTYRERKINGERQSKLEMLEKNLQPIIVDRDRTRAELEGFRVNFDALIAEEETRLRAKLKDDRARVEARAEEAQSMFEFANERERVIDRLGTRFLKDTNKWVSQKVRPDNFATSHDRLVKVIDFCRKHEFDVPASTERELVEELREKYEEVVRKDIAKQEQRRIKEQIREEQRAERELAKRIAKEEAERKLIERALAEALAKAADEHSDEIEQLKAQLAEAEARTIRTQAMAEITRAGHVYVISNVGSFGDGIFKIGMTRRLEPMDRVKELGDASVPFPFDVHMMISCDDAPTLEKALHHKFNHRRLNRVNLRKEYFRVTIDEICEVVEAEHGIVDYVAVPEALEYHESMTMTDEELDYVSEQIEATGVLSSVDDEDD